MKIRHLIPFLFSLPLAAQTCTTATCNAASASQSDFLAALPSNGNANATVVVKIPSGNSSWTTAISGYTIPATVTDLTIQGNTTVSCTGTPGTSGFVCTPTDNTIIQDAVASNVPILSINTGAASTHFTLKGVTFRGGNIGSTSNNKYNGVIAFGGSTNNFRMTQVHIDNSTYNPAGTQSSWVRFNGPITGVMDNNYWNLCTNSACIGVSTNGFQAFNTIGDSIGLGDGTWGNATPWGTSKAVFAETSYFKGGYTDDCTFAGFFVIRYSYLEDVSVTAQTHATKSQGGPERGCRGYEEYHNYSKQSTATFAFSGSKGGPALVWGNLSASGSWNWVFAACTDRQCNTGTETNTPQGWGFCGSSAVNPSTGLANGTASAWDRNNPSSSVGYPCLDGVGRGQTPQVLNGVVFCAPGTTYPSCGGRLNSATGTIAWPQQFLEPVYLWNNTITGAGGGFLNTGDLSTTNNRDIYFDCNSLNSSCSGGFSGSAGTGFGLHSARPAACTPGPGSTNGASPTGSYGVAYFATDDNAGNGELYVCDGAPANHWQPIYQPYTYPHPLTGSVSQVATPIYSPSFGAPPQTVSISVSGTSVSFTGTEGSNANASNGSAPHRNEYTNCINGCVSGVKQPTGSGIFVGQLACTTTAQTASSANGCGSVGLVSTTITGTGTTPLDNGRGAGGTDSLASVTTTFGGVTAGDCPVGTSVISALNPSITLPGVVANARAIFSGTTASSPFNTSLLSPTKWAFTGGDSANNYIVQICDTVPVTSGTGFHLEMDMNHTLSTHDYIGLGTHYNFTDSKWYYCPQGCSAWKPMQEVESNGTVHTTLPLPAGHHMYWEFYFHRNPTCTSSSGTGCEFYDAMCQKDFTAGGSLTCYALQDVVTGKAPSGIPLNLPGFTANEINLQHQLDYNQGSFTGSVNSDFRSVVAFSGPSICYTTSGATPTAAIAGVCDGSPTQTYTIPVDVTVNPTTLSAIGTQTGFLNSNVGTATYSGVTPVCADPVQVSPNFSGTYNVPPTVLPLAIGFSSPTSGCVMHAIISGGAANCSSPTYSGSSSISSTTAVSVIACQTGFTSSNLVGGTWTIIGGGSPPPPPQITVIMISKNAENELRNIRKWKGFQ